MDDIGNLTFFPTNFSDKEIFDLRKILYLLLCIPMHEQSFFTMPVLFAFAIPHTIFAIVFLISKEGRRLHDILASVWILLLVFPITLRFIFSPGESSFLGEIFRSLVYSLFYGPMAYLYTRSLVEENPILRKNDFLHFIPILISGIIIFFLPDHLNPHQPPPPPHAPPPINPPAFLITSFFIDAANLISILGYSFFILKLLKYHVYSVENYFSTITNTRNLKWLKWTIWLFIFLFTWNSFSPVLFKFALHSMKMELVHPSQFRFFHSGIFVLFSYILSFFTIRQSIVYPDVKNDFLETKPEMTKEEKYTRSGLKEGESQQIAKKLLDYMEKEKPYLREDLRIREVADELGVNLNYLSQTLNEIIQKNFYQFVNEYRVKEVQTRLKDPKFHEYPLLRIALDCGFNSKSSFNSTFRRFTEISPTEFRKSLMSG